MLVLSPTDNGNAEGNGERKITVDSRFVSKDGNFGGNRAVSSTPAQSTDYKRPTLGAPNRKENPVDTTTKDVDDLDDIEVGKDQTTRLRNASELVYKKEHVFEYTDKDNRPLEETDAFEPDPTDPDFLVKKRRSKIKGHYGDGQYANMPNRGYEGEVR